MHPKHIASTSYPFFKFSKPARIHYTSNQARCFLIGLVVAANQRHTQAFSPNGRRNVPAEVRHSSRHAPKVIPLPAPSFARLLSSQKPGMNVETKKAAALVESPVAHSRIPRAPNVHNHATLTSGGELHTTEAIQQLNDDAARPPVVKLKGKNTTIFKYSDPREATLAITDIHNMEARTACFNILCRDQKWIMQFYLTSNGGFGGSLVVLNFKTFTVGNHFPTEDLARLALKDMLISHFRNTEKSSNLVPPVEKKKVEDMVTSATNSLEAKTAGNGVVFKASPMLASKGVFDGTLSASTLAGTNVESNKAANVVESNLGISHSQMKKKQVVPNNNSVETLCSGAKFIAKERKQQLDKSGAVSAAMPPSVETKVENNTIAKYSKASEVSALRGIDRHNMLERTTCFDTLCKNQKWKVQFHLLHRGGVGGTLHVPGFPSITISNDLPNSDFAILVLKDMFMSYCRNNERLSSLVLSIEKMNDSEISQASQAKYTRVIPNNMVPPTLSPGEKLNAKETKQQLGRSDAVKPSVVTARIKNTTIWKYSNIEIRNMLERTACFDILSKDQKWNTQFHLTYKSGFGVGGILIAHGSKKVTRVTIGNLVPNTELAILVLKYMLVSSFCNTEETPSLGLPITEKVKDMAMSKMHTLEAKTTRVAVCKASPTLSKRVLDESLSVPKSTEAEAGNKSVIVKSAKQHTKAKVAPAVKAETELGNFDGREERVGMVEVAENVTGQQAKTPIAKASEKLSESRTHSGSVKHFKSVMCERTHASDPASQPCSHCANSPSMRIKRASNPLPAGWVWQCANPACQFQNFASRNQCSRCDCEYMDMNGGGYGGGGHFGGGGGGNLPYRQRGWY